MKRHGKSWIVRHTWFALGLLLLLGCASFDTKNERWEAAPLSDPDPDIWRPGYAF